jgi:hypothetical protein
MFFLHQSLLSLDMSAHQQTGHVLPLDMSVCFTAACAAQSHVCLQQECVCVYISLFYTSVLQQFVLLLDISPLEQL